MLFGTKAITIQYVITALVFFLIWAKERNARKLTLRVQRTNLVDGCVERSAFVASSLIPKLSKQVIFPCSAKVDYFYRLRLITFKDFIYFEGFFDEVVPLHQVNGLLPLSVFLPFQQVKALHH